MIYGAYPPHGKKQETGIATSLLTYHYCPVAISVIELPLDLKTLYCSRYPLHHVKPTEKNLFGENPSDTSLGSDQKPDKFYPSELLDRQV